MEEVWSHLVTSIGQEEVQQQHMDIFNMEHSIAGRRELLHYSRRHGV